MRWEDAQGSQWTASGLIHGRYEEMEPVPDFEHSLDACALAEAEIDKRGLFWKYWEVLCDMWRRDHELDQGQAEFLIRLTPAQRCEAILKAIEGSHG
jgi:hypothetical protein